jgi:hypothetical protein
MRVPGALPRAVVVAGVRVSDGDAAAALFADESFDPFGEVILASGAPAPASPAGLVRRARLECDAAAVEVEAERPGHLVLVDAYDPGWRATVDGRSAEVHRANVAFRAVPVPAGRHVVEMRYRPVGLPGGAIVSLIGLATALLMVRREHRGHGETKRPQRTD